MGLSIEKHFAFNLVKTLAQRMLGMIELASAQSNRRLCGRLNLVVYPAHMISYGILSA